MDSLSKSSRAYPTISLIARRSFSVLLLPHILFSRARRVLRTALACAWCIRWIARAYAACLALASAYRTRAICIDHRATTDRATLVHPWATRGRGYELSCVPRGNAAVPVSLERANPVHVRSGYRAPSPPVEALHKPACILASVGDASGFMPAGHPCFTASRPCIPQRATIAVHLRVRGRYYRPYCVSPTGHRASVGDTAPCIPRVRLASVHPRVRGGYPSPSSGALTARRASARPWEILFRVNV